MDKTVWSDGKNITVEINNDPAITVRIGRQNYNRGTYSFKLADDEDLIVSVACDIPKRKIVHDGDVVYFKIYYMDGILRSYDGRQVSNSFTIDNNDINNRYFSERCIAPFTKFKNGDKLILTARIMYYLKEM
nr:MAG TPA: hypothetical protein [Caudoviricetes sp.]